MRNTINANHGVVGAGSGYGSKRQKEDFYTTGDGAITKLEEVYELPKKVWECACGNGALSKQLEENGHTVYSTELYKRGYGKQGVDFFSQKKMPSGYDCICTNPPFNQAVEFIKHSLSLVSKRKGVVCMLLKLAFLETKQRYEDLFYDNPPTYVFVFITRLNCYNNDNRNYGSSMMPFAWYVWDNSVKNDAPEILLVRLSNNSKKKVIRLMLQRQIRMKVIINQFGLLAVLSVLVLLRI